MNEHKRWVNAILGLVFALAASSSHALSITVTNPGTVGPGGTTTGNLNLDLGSGNGSFYIDLTIPTYIRLLTMADHNPSDGDAIYQRRFYTKTTSPVLWFEGTFAHNKAVFSSLVGLFTSDGSHYYIFNEDPFFATNGKYGVLVTNIDATDYSNVDIEFQISPVAPLGEYDISWTVGACTASPCAPDTASGTMKVRVPEPPLILSLLGGLWLLAGWRRRA